MSAAGDHRLAAQRRAEELVARIKSDKAARELTPTRERLNMSASSSVGGGSIGGGSAGGYRSVGAASVDAGLAPESANAMSRSVLNTTQTPERTPQMQTPGRDAIMTSSLLRSSTPPRSSPPRSSPPRSSPPRSSPPRPRLNPSPPRASSRSASPSRSPTRTEAAASAMEMANAAIESARRVAAGDASSIGPGVGGVVRVPSPVSVPLGSSHSVGGVGRAHSHISHQSSSASSPRPGTAEFVPYPAPGSGGRVSPGISRSQSFGSKGTTATMSNLDLRNNDNAFHVVANIVTDRLLPKVPPGTTSYSLDSSDRAFFDQMLPVTMRWSFVDALRYRRQFLRAEEQGPQESTITTLTRKCCWLGLDRPEEENVLLQPEVATTQVGLSSVAPQAYQPPAIRPSRSVDRGGVGLSPSFRQMSMDEADAAADALAWRERSIQEQQARLQEQQQSFQQQQLEAQEELYKQQLKLQRGQIQSQQDQIKQLLDVSASTIGTFSSEGQQQQQQQNQVGAIDYVPPQPPDSAPNSLHAAPARASEALDATMTSEASMASIESRARQQVMAELKEATALMTSSVTPEAAKFWKAHVVDLQARLRALNGEAPELAPTENGPADGYHLADDATGTLDNARRYVGKTFPPREKVTSHYAGPRETQAEYLERNRKMREEGVIDARVEHVVADASVVQPKRTIGKEPPRNESNGYDGHPMVDVVAPADLPAGYTFEAQIGSKRFLATVPTGGVLRGDRFSCAMKSLDRVEIQVPTGHWRDELFDMFKFGFFHPLVLNTVFVPLIALGQVMTRNQLTWLGEQGNRFQSKSVPMNMMMVILFWASMNCMTLFHLAVNLNRGNLPTFVDYTALFVVNIAMIAFTVYVVANTRRSIRTKYGIPEDSCGGKEDVLITALCLPCTITQMGRHTADFETYRAVCCSDTGLPRNVELVPAPSAGRNYPALDDSHMV